MKRILIVIVTTIIAITIISCSGNIAAPDITTNLNGVESAESVTTSPTQKPTEAPNKQEVYTLLTPKEAKEIIDSQSGYIILDVRTQQEFDEGHIENAILLPDYEVKQKAEDALTDKNQMILVYCRSGRRSSGAAQTLIKMGYTNVYDFGGILDWPYDIIK